MKKEEAMNKLMEMLNPYLISLNIDDDSNKKAVYNKLVNNKILNGIMNRDAIKYELFEEVSVLSKQLKVELLKLQPVQEMSVKEFNSKSEVLNKIFVDFSSLCSRKVYSFSASLDKNNIETLVINSADGKERYDLTGATFRKLVSDISFALNDTLFLNPDKLIKVTVENFNMIDLYKKLELDLTLDEAVGIINEFTSVLNSKYYKVSNKSFAFNIDKKDAQPTKKNNNTSPDNYNESERNAIRKKFISDLGCKFDTMYNTTIIDDGGDDEDGFMPLK